MKFFEDCAIGDEFESHDAYRITAEEMDSFARKWDPQRYHLDEREAARLMGRLFASATLTLCAAFKLTHESGYYEISPAAGLGIDEVRTPAPVFADDQLKAKVTIVSKRDSKSRPELGVMVSKHEVANQHGTIVLSYLLSSLIYKRPQ